MILYYIQKSLNVAISINDEPKSPLYTSMATREFIFIIFLNLPAIAVYINGKRKAPYIMYHKKYSHG